MDNLEAMDKFLERYNLPTLNQEERENKNRSNVLTEIMIKNLPKRSLGPEASQVNSIKYLEKSYHPSL